MRFSEIFTKYIKIELKKLGFVNILVNVESYNNNYIIDFTMPLSIFKRIRLLVCDDYIGLYEANWFYGYGGLRYDYDITNPSFNPDEMISKIVNQIKIWNPFSSIILRIKRRLI